LNQYEKKFKISFILVTCALPTRQIPSSGMDIREGKRGSHLGPFFPEIPYPLLRALHHCLVEKVMYHSRATFEEAMKQVVRFSK